MATKIQVTFSEIQDNLGFTGGLLPEQALVSLPEQADQLAETPLIVAQYQGWGFLIVHRPKGLNALDPVIVKQMYDWLVAWKKDDTIAGVMVFGAGDKAFCAGGDVKSVVETLRDSDPAFDAETATDKDLPRTFFFDEYRLNREIQAYPKPYISFINGISMGGGMGISIHGTHRVVGDDLMMAMPETTIGLFPDVGGGYFLSRMPGKVGTYLSLTGDRLGADDAMYLSLGTHYIPKASQQAAIAGLLDISGDGFADKVADYLDGVSEAVETGRIEKLQADIDRCFAGKNVVEILARLDQLAAEGNEFAQKQAKSLRQKCPFSLCLSFEQLVQADGLSFDDHMRMEFRMVQRCLMQPDFVEGVRALLIDKDKSPKWQHQDVSEVSEDLIAACFAPFKNSAQELTFES